MISIRKNCKNYLLADRDLGVDLIDDLEEQEDKKDEADAGDDE